MPAPVAPQGHSPQRDLGLLWVRHAAEYHAAALQVYKEAERDLPGFLEDRTWSALPGQTDAAELPPAIIFDVDETVVSNVEFQLTYEPPFANWKLDEWSRSRPAEPVPGFAHFARTAQAAGVDLFFVTNRPCEPVEGIADPCPQKQTTLDDLAETGIDTEPEYLMLANEREGWSREKRIRRELIGRTHRILMVIGDDLSDFIHCVRNRQSRLCPDPVTEASRLELVEQHAEYFGAGWYIVPNPMHGSWTNFVDIEGE